MQYNNEMYAGCFKLTISINIILKTYSNRNFYSNFEL